MPENRKVEREVMVVEVKRKSIMPHHPMWRLTPGWNHARPARVYQTDLARPPFDGATFPSKNFPVGNTVRGSFMRTSICLAIMRGTKIEVAR